MGNLLLNLNNSKNISFGYFDISKNSHEIFDINSSCVFMLFK